MNTISNEDDTIDSRDVIERISELETELEGADAETMTQAQEESAAELVALKALANEAEGYAPDWIHGTQLIRYSYFEQAMDDMVAECYELPKDMPFWMTVTYDYEALKQDYTEVDFDGVTYLIR